MPQISNVHTGQRVRDSILRWVGVQHWHNHLRLEVQQLHQALRRPQHGSRRQRLHPLQGPQRLSQG